MDKLAAAAMMAAVTTLLSGCATIVGEPTQLVPISSTPSDATVRITDERGTEIFKGSTPTSVTLKKSDGTYWGGKDYTVHVSKDGYGAQSIPIESTPNGWYIAGNLVFGGLIGWFIVDPFNGDMYTLSPKDIAASMSASAQNDTARDGRIAVMLVDDVPKELRDKMQRLDR